MLNILWTYLFITEIIKISDIDTIKDTSHPIIMTLMLPFIFISIPSMLYIFYFKYLKKDHKLQPLKLLFVYEIPIVILTLFCLLQEGMITIGTSITFLLFLFVILYKLWITLKKKPINNKILSIFDGLEHTFSLYFSIILIIAFIFSSSFSPDILFYTFFTFTIIANLYYLTKGIIKKRRRYNLKLYSLTIVSMILFMIGISLFNQHYSYTMRRFDNLYYIQLIHTKNYQIKKSIKKQIKNNYTQDEFSNLLRAKDSTPSEDYYIFSAKAITDDILYDSPTFIKTTYGYILSFLMPTENEYEKKNNKAMMIASIYDCENCTIKPKLTGFKSLEPIRGNINDDVKINTANEYITIDQGFINSTVEINLHNNSTQVRESQIDFKLPEGSIITGMWVHNPATSNEYVNSQFIPKSVANALYIEEREAFRATNRPKDPVTLTNLYFDYYQLKAFPIPANSDYNIKLQYITYRTILSENDKIEIDGLDVNHKVVENFKPNDTNISDFYVSSNENDCYAILKTDLTSKTEVKTPVVLVIDTSYSMEEAFGDYNLKNIYNELKQNGIDPIIYTHDNGISKISYTKLDYFNDYVGYSNRKIAFNQILDTINETNVHIIYITDDSYDIEFNDYDYSRIAYNRNNISTFLVK